MFQTKPCAPLLSIVSTSTSVKIAAKKRWSLTKTAFWTSKQPFVLHSSYACSIVCPVAIPKIFTQTRGSDYWKLIHSTYLPWWWTLSTWTRKVLFFSRYFVRAFKLIRLKHCLWCPQWTSNFLPEWLKGSWSDDIISNDSSQACCWVIKFKQIFYVSRDSIVYLK